MKVYSYSEAMKKYGAYNLFKIAEYGNADIICVPTNLVVNKKNEAIMGKGMAAECARRFSGSKKELGKNLIQAGKPDNSGVCIPFNDYDYTQFIAEGISENNKRYEIISFPTKYNWRNFSSLQLIEKSIISLIEYTKEIDKDESIFLPAIGCGCGNFKWNDVYPKLKNLDNRFVCIVPDECKLLN